MVKSVSQPVRRIRTPIRARENDSDSGPSLVQLRMGMFQQAGLHQAGPSGLVVRGQPAGQAHGQQGRPQDQLGPLEQQIGDVQLDGADQGDGVLGDKVNLAGYLDPVVPGPQQDP